MREKIARFMIGRNGVDQFGKFLLRLCLIILIISFIIPVRLIYWFAFAILIYGYFRIFSRNIPSRSRENLRYIEISGKVKDAVRNFFGKHSSKATFTGGSRRTYDQESFFKIFKCPKCKQKLRVPKGKGKICITCKRCGYSFIKRS